VCNQRGGMCEWLKQAVLKTAVPERVPGVRIPLPPPRSLYCREFLPRFPAKSANYAHFLRFLLDKPDCGERTTAAVARANTIFFSAAAMSSPVSMVGYSERQAITNRLPSEDGLDFIFLKLAQGHVHRDAHQPTVEA
jgi:hypothetical protein